MISLNKPLSLVVLHIFPSLRVFVAFIIAEEFKGSAFLSIGDLVMNAEYFDENLLIKIKCNVID